MSNNVYFECSGLLVLVVKYNKQIREQPNTASTNVGAYRQKMTHASLKNHELFILKIPLSRKISHKCQPKFSQKNG